MAVLCIEKKNSFRGRLYKRRQPNEEDSEVMVLYEGFVSGGYDTRIFVIKGALTPPPNVIT